MFEIYPGDEEYDNALFEKYTQEDPEVKQFIASEGMRNWIHVGLDSFSVERIEMVSGFKHPLFKKLKPHISPKLWDIIIEFLIRF